MTTDTALALLRDAAGNLYMAYNAFTRNDAIAWEPLKETADRITALLDSAIKSQPVPVEPEQIKMMRYDEPEGRSDYERAITDYIDSLQSALKVAQMERTAERERGDQWETTATNLLERAEKAESEREQFRKDAERYRWLRDKEVSIRIGGIASPDDDSSEIEVQCLRQIPEVLDSAIDSARNK